MPINVVNFDAYGSEKIKTENEIRDIVQRERLKGKKVGLGVGGYDLLHPGHMTHLSSAKKICDVLIIGVTSDEFNTKRKGMGRPVYPAGIRAFSLSQLKSIDFVFISRYPSAVEVIKSLKPDFYIKGPDFIEKQTPGITAEREAIKSVHGEMKYTTEEKLSTTEIIDYIKNELK